MNTVFLLLLAIFPGLAIAILIYLRDIRQPEPYRLLLMSVVFGVICYFISRGLGFLLHHFIYINHEDVVHQMLSAFVFVGLVGEGSKFLFLRGFTFYYKDFNHPFDGIVFAIMVGMGYATAENIMYVLSADTDSAILRIITSAPANAVFAVIMGYFLGEAKFFKNKALLYSVIALLFAALAHGYYDYFLTMLDIKGLWMQAIVSIIIVIVLVQLAFKRMNNAEMKMNGK